MTDTIESMPARIDRQQLAQDLVDAAHAEGVEVVGPGGLLTGLTTTVLETAPDAERSEHVGYVKHDAVGRDGGNPERHQVDDGAHEGPRRASTPATGAQSRPAGPSPPSTPR